MNTLLQWSPLLPDFYIALLAGLSLLLILVALWKKVRDLYARPLFFALLALLLLNPLMVHETRQPLPSKMVVVVDESPSEDIGGRMETAEKILSHLKSSVLTAEPVVIRAGRDPASRKNQNTSLFSAMRGSLMSIPAGQVSGTVLITDGQVHDVPETLGALEALGPFNVILTGRKNEFDRKITITDVPKYGLVNQDVTIRVTVEDAGKAPAAPIVLSVMEDGKPAGQYTVRAGETQDYAFNISHAGQNIFEFSVAAEDGELTAMNNTAAVIVNGIRDRLRVLLVSGMPHMGERAWRDLLKSDPSIDLIHFNILRSLQSFDMTPADEMSLIPFPVDELFERKIKDFDLIIFDKYMQYSLMRPEYFDNISSFVKNGGAFLMAMGSDAPEQSLFTTALADILPIAPKPADASILSTPYVPQVTDAGKVHPVTADLQTGKSAWGPWFTQTDVMAAKGQTLMTGANGSPLLILDTVGDGRVAVLTSDNIWLWSKNLQGGGPYTELLRNTAHWLMREPSLEQDYIRTETTGDTITVSERAQADGKGSLTMTRPDGREEALTLATPAKGWNTTQVPAEQNGIYRFSNGSRTAFAIVGTTASAELSDVHTTAEKLRPLAAKTKGKVLWYADNPGFTAADLSQKKNAAYTVASVDSTPLIPGWLSALLIFAGLVCVWRLESGSSKA